MKEMTSATTKKTAKAAPRAKKASAMTLNEAKTIAKWMLDNDASCREAARHFDYQKSAINGNLNSFDLGPRLNHRISVMFKRHKKAAYLSLKASAGKPVMK